MSNQRRGVSGWGRWQVGVCVSVCVWGGGGPGGRVTFARLHKSSDKSPPSFFVRFFFFEFECVSGAKAKRTEADTTDSGGQNGQWRTERTVTVQKR